MKHEWRFANSTGCAADGKLRAMLRSARSSLVSLAVGLLPACSDDMVPPPPAPLTSEEGSVLDGESSAGTGSGTATDAPAGDDLTSMETDSEGAGAAPPAQSMNPSAAAESAPASEVMQQSTTFEAENLEIGGQYADGVSSPFSGVALYANGDSVTLEHTFSELPGDYRIDVTGASSNSLVATADVQLGTRSLGTLAFRGTSSSVQTLEFSILASTPATRSLTLAAINDNDSWDLFVDKIELTFIGPTQ